MPSRELNVIGIVVPVLKRLSKLSVQKWSHLPKAALTTPVNNPWG